VVNVVTKSGSNEFKGEAWFNFLPGQLEPKRIGRAGEAAARDRFVNNRGIDFGITLGGPIIKDRVWFFVGIAPDWTQVRTHRVIRRRLSKDLPATQMSGTYQGDVDTDAAAVCPDYIKDRDPALCVAGNFKTEDLAGADRDFFNSTWAMNYIGKVDVRIDDDNKFSFEYIGTPQVFDGFGASNSKVTAVKRPPPAVQGEQLGPRHHRPLHLEAPRSPPADRRPHRLPHRGSVAAPGHQHARADRHPHRVLDGLRADRRLHRRRGPRRGLQSLPDHQLPLRRLRLRQRHHLDPLLAQLSKPPCSST
jgi:hypothetical protein